jgi:hypothetical protein
MFRFLTQRDYFTIREVRLSQMRHHGALKRPDFEEYSSASLTNRYPEGAGDENLCVTLDV